jgi:hypothetical protein
MKLSEIDVSAMRSFYEESLRASFLRPRAGALAGAGCYHSIALPDIFSLPPQHSRSSEAATSWETFINF